MKHVNRLKLRNDRKSTVDTRLVVDGADACYDGKERPRKSNGVDFNKSGIYEKGNQLGKKICKKVMTCQNAEGETDDGENELKKQKKKVKHLENLEHEAENEQKKQKKHHRKNEKQEAGVIKDKRNKRKIEKAHLDVINDTETSFINLLSDHCADNMKPNDEQNGDIQAARNFDKVSALVTYLGKKKKNKLQGAGDSLLWFPTTEVGLGGPSAWNDDDELLPMKDW